MRDIFEAINKIQDQISSTSSFAGKLKEFSETAESCTDDWLELVEMTESEFGALSNKSSYSDYVIASAVSGMSVEELRDL